MTSILYNLKDNLSEYANIISEVLDVDVEIIDIDLIRVAGTGRKENLIDIYMEDEGYVCKHVLKSKQKLVVEKPGLHRICLENCEKKKACDLSFVVSNPIILDEETIGAINLLCFTEEKKIKVKKNLKMFSNFFGNISHLIAAEAGMVDLIKENQIIANEFIQVLETIDNGVILLDENKRIKYGNRKAEEILNRKLYDLKGLYFGEVIISDSSTVEENEYYIWYKGKRKEINVKYYPVYQEKNLERYILNIWDVNKRDTNLDKQYKVSDKLELNNFVGNDNKILELKKNIKQFAKTDSTILITGESGTGKEIVAKALHIENNRKNNPFIVVNCAAIPENLLESELFGYVGGAFTGASSKGKIGKFELANKGTIFLDEIGDMPLQLQPKLLRVLEEKKIQRIGSNQSIDLDVKVISATNQNLKLLIEKGEFREDLYYRLCVIPMEIPPLRDRKGDIKLLTRYFVNKFSNDFERPVFRIDKLAMEELLSYNWPGNVRELKNTIEYLANIVGSNHIVTEEMLPKHIKNKSISKIERNLEADCINISKDMNIEKQELIRLLQEYGNSVKGKKIIAKKMGISISTLYRKIKEYGIKKTYR